MGIMKLFQRGVDAIHDKLLSGGYLQKAASRYVAAEKGEEYSEFGANEIDAFDPSSEYGQEQVKEAARILIVTAENYDRGHYPEVESAADILKRDYGINLDNVRAEFDNDHGTDHDYDDAAPA